jgi:F420-non-reducing hydrogenase small subunit
MESSSVADEDQNSLMVERLNTCGGCDISILDIGEKLFDMLSKLQLVHDPYLVDNKYYGETGEGTEINLPKADIGIISGGIRNEEQKEIAKKMRDNCKTIIALGSCATQGGIPALMNMFKNEEMLNKVYRESNSTESADTPNENLPQFTDRVYAVAEFVDVDIEIPGCPTNPGLIGDALEAVLEGKSFSLPERSVCDDCPVKREKKAEVEIKRPLQNAQFTPGQYDSMRCFNEQGLICLGPVTRSGCGKPYVEDEEMVPRCVKGYMPCRGCFGPIRKGANPMVDMMGAMSSIGLNARQVDDRRALLSRYTGGFNRLRPLPQRPNRS